MKMGHFQLLKVGFVLYLNYYLILFHYKIYIDYPRAELIKRISARAKDMIANGAEIPFKRINNSLKHCRGVLYAHDSIYVSATDSQAFYRLRDTSGDGTLDKEELLLPLEYKSRFVFTTCRKIFSFDSFFV